MQVLQIQESEKKDRKELLLSQDESLQHQKEIKKLQDKLESVKTHFEQQCLELQVRNLNMCITLTIAQPIMYIRCELHVIVSISFSNWD